MRWYHFILICVALGAVTTVGVAWFAAAWSSYQRSWAGAYDVAFTPVIIETDDTYRAEAAIGVRTGPGVSILMPTATVRPVTIGVLSEQTQFSMLRELCHRCSWENVTDAPPAWMRGLRFTSNAEPVLHELLECGWPLRCLHGARRGRVDDHTLANVWLMGEQSAANLALPLRPLPIGFAINTVFYGALWFGIIACPGFVRRRIRQRRDGCPSCGYDLRGSDGACPECGAYVAQNTLAACVVE